MLVWVPRGGGGALQTAVGGRRWASPSPRGRSCASSQQTVEGGPPPSCPGLTTVGDRLVALVKLLRYRSAKVSATGSFMSITVCSSDCVRGQKRVGHRRQPCRAAIQARTQPSPTWRRGACLHGQNSFAITPLPIHPDPQAHPTFQPPRTLSTDVFCRQMTLALPMSPAVPNLMPSLVTEISTAHVGCSGDARCNPSCFECPVSPGSQARTISPSTTPFPSFPLSTPTRSPPLPPGAPSKIPNPRSHPCPRWCSDRGRCAETRRRASEPRRRTPSPEYLDFRC